MRTGILVALASFTLIVTHGCKSGPLSGAAPLGRHGTPGAPLDCHDAQPLIVGWSSVDRGRLAGMLRERPIAVRYVGSCDVELLPACKVKGSYVYVPGDHTRDRVTIRDADALRLLTPRAPALATKLESSGEIDVGMLVVGSYEARPMIFVDEATGDCAGATHYIRSATVGAFTVAAGEGGSEPLDRDGDDTACEGARVTDLAPPVGCAAPMRIALAPIRPKRATGTPCTTPGHAVCGDEGTALRCREDKTFLAIPCRGPRGCSLVGGDVSCDDDVGEEGDVCIGGATSSGASGGENYACTPDHKRAVACKDGVFHLWRQCRGARGCAVQGTQVTCDTNVQELGDPCGKAGTYACTLDHATLLRCDANGKMIADNSCRGPNACAVDPVEHKVGCDDSIASEGDPCSDERQVACSPDKKSRLVCRSQKYATDRPCKRAGGCEWVKGEKQPRCDS